MKAGVGRRFRDDPTILVSRQNGVAKLVQASQLVRHWHRRPPPWKLGLQISVLLPSDRWLNVATTVLLPRPWAWHSFVSLGELGLPLSPGSCKCMHQLHAANEQLCLKLGFASVFAFFWQEFFIVNCHCEKFTALIFAIKRWNPR